VTNNNLALTEAGLITFMKDHSFKKQLTTFQNSLIQSRDPTTGKVTESILNEGQLVNKSLLLLQGIPSSGVFELDQESLTFSLNANKRVYLTSRNGNA
jgi:hypothetical protein